MSTSTESTPDYTPATTRAKIGLAAGVLAMGAAIIAGWVLLFQHIQVEINTEYKVPWVLPSGAALSPGPSSFYFDAKRKELVVRGAISDSEKQDLVKLLTNAQSGQPPPSQARQSYFEALDKLAFESNENGEEISLLLLILAGMSGLLGVQLRSLINYVGNACFKNKLDVVRWWPWYVVRPGTGIILGIIAILLFRVGLFEPKSPSTDLVTWGLIVGILAGFGAEEFSQRLRDVTQTLFGVSPK